MIERSGTIGRASRFLSDIRLPSLREKMSRALRSGGVALADQSLVSGVNFVTTILLARVIGSEGFGVYSLAWIVMLFVASLQVAFLGSAMMSIGPKQDDSQKPAYFGAVLVQQTAFTGVCIVVVAILCASAGRLVPDAELARLALPLSVAVLSYQLQEFFRRYFYARERTAAASPNLCSWFF